MPAKPQCAHQERRHKMTPASRVGGKNGASHQNKGTSNWNLCKVSILQEIQALNLLRWACQIFQCLSAHCLPNCAHWFIIAVTFSHWPVVREGPKSLGKGVTLGYWNHKLWSNLVDALAQARKCLLQGWFLRDNLVRDLRRNLTFVVATMYAKHFFSKQLTHTESRLSHGK